MPSNIPPSNVFHDPVAAAQAERKRQMRFQQPRTNSVLDKGTSVWGDPTQHKNVLRWKKHADDPTPVGDTEGSPTGVFESSLEIVPNGWGDISSDARGSSTPGFNGAGSNTWGNPPPLSKSSITPATSWGDNGLRSNSGGWDNGITGSVCFLLSFLK